jgi:hypothetical protein
MAKLFVTLTAITVLVAANAFSIAETGNAPEAFGSIGKTDRLEISISPRPDAVVLEQREIGLSKLYLTDAGKAAAMQPTHPDLARASACKLRAGRRDTGEVSETAAHLDFPEDV